MMAVRALESIRRDAKRAVRAGVDAMLPRSLWLTRGSVSRSSVYLTFDDGPDPTHTPAVLDALAKAGARATFFVVGRRAQRHPEILRRIVAEGHGLGHHSFEHDTPSAVSWRDLLRELERTDRVLNEEVGATASIFRPPHGKLTPPKLIAAWWHGVTVVLWSLDPKDYSAITVDDTRSFFERRPPRAGDIVLLHDVNPRAASVVEWLVPALHRRGLTCDTLTTAVP